MVDKTNLRVYTMYTMKAITILIAALLLTACSGIVYKDPRCQINQYCAYTDPPPPIRTWPLRTAMPEQYQGYPAAR